MITPAPIATYIPGAPAPPAAVVIPAAPTLAEVDAIKAYVVFYKNVLPDFPEQVARDEISLREAYLSQETCEHNKSMIHNAIVHLHEQLDELTVAINRGFSQERNRYRLSSNVRSNITFGKPLMMLLGLNNKEIPEHLVVPTSADLKALTSEKIDPILAFYKVVVPAAIEDDEDFILQLKRKALHSYLLTGRSMYV